jgi:uncharacterized membrane protein
MAAALRPYFLLFYAIGLVVLLVKTAHTVLMPAS